MTGPIMPGGLAALLDDIATIAKIAAASLDDVSAAAGKAAAKSAGVVIDDTAVTPGYVTGFTADRELPIIWRIARGSLFNKLVVITPAVLLLSILLPAAITPILMAGGLFLCFEGAEKIIHALTHREDLAAEVQEMAEPGHEETMVRGAIRTDFILSAEIMVIALNEVAGEGLLSRAGALVIVAIGITILVYGAVGLIVKMDDIGLNLAQREGAATRALGRGLVKAMPHVLTALAAIGTAAMLWVGGQIVVHGAGLHPPEWLGLHEGFTAWLAHTAISGTIGLALGSVIVGLLHVVKPGH
jgi:predicted DNA repair protein MutK